jgi:hypothetical protein
MCAALFAAVGVSSSPATPHARVAVVAPVSRGAIDAEVRSGGKLIGDLHGSVAPDGHGKAKFQPVSGSSLTAEIIGLKVTKVDKHEHVRGLGHGVSIRLRITSSNKVTGSGKIHGRRIRIIGAGGEKALDLKKGMKMLVVGHPRGEGYETLRRYFRAVHYDPKKHARHILLDERHEFESYAALVFGPDVSTARIHRHGLIHAFYNSGKWVILAPAYHNRLNALNEFHPFVTTNYSPAIAVRSVGAEGAIRNTRPTVVYTTPARVPVTQRIRLATGKTATVRVKPLSAKALARNKRRRARGFVEQLRKWQRAYTPSGSSARVAQASQGPPVDLGEDAAAIVIPVYVGHEHVQTGSGGAYNNPLCGWNRSSQNAWCPNTYYWKEQSDQYGEPGPACRNFLSKGYTMIHQRSVSGGLNSQGAYTVKEKSVDNYAFMLQNGFDYYTPDCPDQHSYTSYVQGTDWYYAIYSANPAQSTLVVVEDMTVTPSSADEKAINVENGIGAVQDCTYRTTLHLTKCKGGKRLVLPESWYLGGYDRQITLHAAEPGASANQQFSAGLDSHFLYDGNRSLPTTTVTDSEETSGKDSSQGFSIGVFGDQGTASYNESSSVSFSRTLQVPSWTVKPNSGPKTVLYQYRTNGPGATWDQIQAGQNSRAGRTFNEANSLNSDALYPQSIATWAGQPVWGRVSITATRTLYFVDHFTIWDPSRIKCCPYDEKDAIDDRFNTFSATYDDGPDKITPTTPKNDTVGPGINFCDPEIRAPQFTDICAKAYATLITIAGSCTNVTGAFTAASVVDNDLKNAAGAKTTQIPCGQTAYVSVKPRDPVSLHWANPPGTTRFAFSCKDATTGAGLHTTSTFVSGIITAEGVTPRRQISCTLAASK